MSRLAIAIAALWLSATAAICQVPSFPQILPPSTVLGRLAIGPGPVQAIPFGVLGLQLGVRVIAAACNGSTDDTATIQAALNLGGGRLPAGNCIVTSPLTVSVNNTVLYGSSRAATTITTSASDSGIVVLTNLTGVQLTDFKITRTDTASSGRDCIHFNTSTERAYIARVDVVACYNGLRLAGTSYSVVDDVFANNNQNHGIYVTNADGAVAGEQWQIYDTLSQQNNGDGLRMEAVTSDSTVGQIHNFYTFANAGHGAAFLGSATPFRLQGPRMHGGFIGSDCASGIYLDTYATITGEIDGVYIEAVGQTACGVNQGTTATNVGSGIQLTSNNTAVELIGNTIISTSYVGVDASAARTMMTGNNIRLAGLAAVGGETACVNLNSGNAALTANSFKACNYGVFVFADNQLIIGNDLTENTTAPWASSATLLLSIIDKNLPATSQQVAPITTVGHGDSIYAISVYDSTIYTTAALTTARTWTLPSAAAVHAGKTFIVADWFGGVTPTSPLTVARAGSDTINGGTSVVLDSAYGSISLTSDGTSKWTASFPGQIPGTATNDNAAAGAVGEYVVSSCPGTGTTATVTITIAAPGVITWTAHGFTTACPVVFTNSGGALPTGITSGTVYYIDPASVTANTFKIATTLANALAGTDITTSGSQSGTQTGTAGAALSSGSAKDMTAVSLTAGDWDCRASLARSLTGSTSVTIMKSSIVTSTTSDGSLVTGTMTQLSTAANVMGHDASQQVGPVRESLSGTTTVFLDADDTFSASTSSAYGSLACRRVR